MMSWNYRVVKDENRLYIYDVYYNEQGIPHGTHDRPTFVCGENIKEMKSQLQRMLEALDKPILEMKEIGKK